MGNVTVTVVPTPGRLSMAADPPCNSVIERTIARPRPVPGRPEALESQTR